MLQKTGSVLQTNAEVEIEEVMSRVQEDPGSEESLAALRSLGLRFFTPREIARLLCFPEDFDFPAEVTDGQRYRLLGNSVNVRVISLMLLLLFSPDRSPGPLLRHMRLSPTQEAEIQGKSGRAGSLDP